MKKVSFEEWKHALNRFVDWRKSCTNHADMSMLESFITFCELKKEECILDNLEY